MSQFDVVMQNVIIGDRQLSEVYQRGFVVSAYGGITNLLLEHKKTGENGVYAFYAQNDSQWLDAMETVRKEMKNFNDYFSTHGLKLESANQFVDERIDGLVACLKDLDRLCSYGHFSREQHLPAVREMLSAVGEAHSARNSAELLKAKGVNAVFVDLTGWKDELNLNFDDMIHYAFKDIDFQTMMPIITGYTKCKEGIMSSYDRGYSEITFSKIACLTTAKEGIIHKEFHLSSGDPKLVGTENVEIIGLTNYDVADQLADLGMEAIHPKAAKGMERLGIPIRVKNAFEPDHPGTLIRSDYRSDQPRVEIITGRTDLIAVEVLDPDMVGQSGYDYRLLGHLKNHKISYVAKNTNANTITHYLPSGVSSLEACIQDIQKALPSAKISTREVAIVSAIGSNMNVPGFLSKSANALAEADINILAMDQCMRQVNMQFIIRCQDFDKAVISLHNALVEK
ncbi:MAG: aspartate kinase [Lentisphaeria bacterium]|nr:aspartate kinase [Lentisphaeria bacterium]